MISPSIRLASCLLAALQLAACGGDAPTAREAFPSTYAPPASEPVLIRGANVLTGTGEELDGADVLLGDGRIAAVGRGLDAPGGARIIDADGRWVTPGIIDVHSHLGVYPSPALSAHSDGNEMSAPVTAEVWAEHSVWPQDPGFAAALAGGVTTLQVLPGSANLIGGRTVTLKNLPARTVQAMKFPGAPHGLKMACGENPKGVYGERGMAPSTRMGNVAGYRAAWIEARDYLTQLEAAAEGRGEMPVRDLRLDTLAGVLRGEILVHNHCYRADEMAIMMDIAEEFGYRIAAFHHATEAYKIADLLAAHGACAAMWADWWGFKLEAFDTVRENVPLVEAAGACAIVHSDSERGIQRLNQEAAKALAAGRRAGLALDRAIAITWITRNAARSLGIAESTGTLEPGKMADVVIWSGDPFSVYTRADQVFIDGWLAYDRSDPARQPVTDFSLGTTGATGGMQ